MNPEFSRPINVEDIPTAGRTWVLEATADECARLAQRFAIQGITSLTAKVKVKPAPHGDTIRVSGSLTGTVVQSCVVTLTPITQQVEEEFSVSSSPAVGGEDPAAELEIDLSADDPPDPIIDGIIDLGEVCAEHLALGLDPFPRSADAEYVDKTIGCDDVAEVKPSPFAVLANLTQKKV